MRLNRSNIMRVLKASWPIVFLVFVTGAVFFTTLILKRRTFYVFPDNIDQFYAWYQKLAVSLHNGKLPIWDANVSAGHSFVGELQAGVFYPINLIWVWLFGSARGISIFWLELIVVFHFWLASVGMYLAARAIGLGKASSLATGLAYAFAGGLAIRSVSQTAIFFGLCYIPWAFFWFQRWLQNHRKINLFWCSLALGFSILAGHVDPWYFACLIIAFSIVFRALHPNFEPWLRTTAKQLLALVVVMAGSLIIALPQVALSAQYLPKAVRFVGQARPIKSSQKVDATTFTKTYSYKPQDVLSLVDPVQYPVSDGNETYIGLTGLAIIIFVLVFLRKSLGQHDVWKSKGQFIIGASAVATLIMVGYWTFVPALLRYLPFFSQVRQLARYSIIVQFCLALMVGICIEVQAANYMKLFRSRKRLVAGVIASTLALGFLVLNTGYLYLVSNRSAAIGKHFVYQNAVLVIALAGCMLMRKKMQYVLLGAMVLSSITQPVWFMPKIANFQATYPPNYYKQTPGVTYLQHYYGRDRVLIEDNALPINIGDVYNIQTIGGYGATLHETFYEFMNEPDTPSQPGLHTNLLNVRFLVSKHLHPELAKIFTDSQRGIYVYERPEYVPRAYFADELAACNLHTPDCTKVTITSYSDSVIQLHYQSNKAEKLVMSEVNYTGWNASVDGIPAKVSSYGPTSVKLFRSIDVPAGSHNVDFRYQPFGL